MSLQHIKLKPLFYLKSKNRSYFTKISNLQQKWEQNVSGYVCNHSSLRMGTRHCVLFRGSLWERLQRDRLPEAWLKTPNALGGRLWRKLMSVCEHKKGTCGTHHPHFFQGGPTGMPEAWPRDAVSRSHSQGTMVTYVTWDVPFRRELYTASSFEGRFGNDMPTPPCWGKSVKKLDS